MVSCGHFQDQSIERLNHTIAAQILKQMNHKFNTARLLRIELKMLTFLQVSKLTAEAPDR
jgi:hypothetical protein